MRGDTFKNAVALWTMVLVLVLSASCGEDDAVTLGDGDTDGDVMTVCTTHADCDPAFYCRLGECVALPIVEGEGAVCTLNAECPTPDQVCAANSRCTPAPGSDVLTDGEPDGEPDGDASCTVDKYRCAPNAELVEVCKDMGGYTDWDVYQACGDEEVCLNASCIDENDVENRCAPEERGDKKCNAANLPIYCNSELTWVEMDACLPGEACLDGECIPTGESCIVCDEFGEPDGCGCSNSTDEYCMELEMGSGEGVCATYCDRDDGTPCRPGYECDRSECRPIEGFCLSDNDCALKEFCDRLPGRDGGSCEKLCTERGAYCPENYRCIDDQADQNYGRCLLRNAECIACSGELECQSAEMNGYCEIPPGQISGCCLPKCMSDDECPGDQICTTDGKCRPQGTGGDCGGSCPQGYVCNREFNMCVLNCPSCQVDECCDAGSAPNCYICTCTNPVACGIGLEQCCPDSNCNAFIYGVAGVCI